MQSILKDLNHYSNFLICFLLLSCAQEQDQLKKIQGYALGTSYSISFVSNKLTPEVLTQKVDSIFEVLNNSLSTYISNSDISKIWFRFYLSILANEQSIGLILKITQ